MNENTVNQTTSTLAELNRIEGFNPEQYARKISDDGQEQRMYLDVKWRILWFRLKYPNGKITTNASKLTETYAVMEARVYCDKDDAAENYISKGMAHRSLDASNPRFGSRFVESAETAAIGRALALAGFGLQFCCDINGEDDSDMADAPIESGFIREQSGQAAFQTNTPDESSGNPNAPSESAPPTQTNEDESDLPFESEPEPQTKAPAGSTSGQSTKLSAPVGLLVNTGNNAAKPAGTNSAAAQNPVKPENTASAANNTAPQNSQNQPTAPKYTKTTPVDDIYRVMTLDEAKSCVIDVGIYQGKTLEQLAKEKPDRIAWYIDSYSGPNNILKTAAKILVEIAANEKLAG